jgi:3-methylfumaryl-CoA hydratase
LHIGEAVRRESRIIDIAEKKGRSGALVLVSVQHEIYGVNGLAITEEQDIVYRPAPSTESPLTKAFSTKAEPVAPVNPPAQNTNAQWSHERSADTVLLFRYSALTFNAHRIHYDYPYTTQVEGYPDLIVHGPLLFTLLVDALLQEYPTVQIESLRVRAMRPLFCNRPFRLQGQLAPDRQQAQLWSLDESGYVTMHVDVVLHADKEN